jgi:aminoglycoside phosphotransferase (APT) family kinase protein
MNQADEHFLGERLGTGRQAEVFVYRRCEDEALAVKLYQPTAPKRSPFREAAILAAVNDLGLPAPAVHGVCRIGERWGVLMSRTEGPSLAQAMSEQAASMPLWLDRMARLQRDVHSRPATQFASLKTRLAANIRQASVLGEARQSALLSGLGEMPDGHRRWVS